MPVSSSIWKVATGGWKVELIIGYLWSSGIASDKEDLVPFFARGVLEFSHTTALPM